jgi:hypothetical protein
MSSHCTPSTLHHPGQYYREYPYGAEGSVDGANVTTTASKDHTANDAAMMPRTMPMTKSTQMTTMQTTTQTKTQMTRTQLMMMQLTMMQTMTQTKKDADNDADNNVAEDGANKDDVNNAADNDNANNNTHNDDADNNAEDGVKDDAASPIAAASLPIGTVVNMSSIINQYNQSGLLRHSFCASLSCDDAELMSILSVRFRMTDHGDDDCDVYGNSCNVDGNGYCQSPASDSAVNLSSATKDGLSKGTVIPGTQITPYNIITAITRRKASGYSILPSGVAGIPQDHEM